MDNNSIPNKPVSVPETSPEEDATLLAIEALEARSVDENPKPWSPMPRPAPATTSMPTPVQQPTPAATPVVKPEPPKVIEPIVPPIAPVVATPPPKPPKPVEVKQDPKVVIGTGPVIQTRTPPVVVKPKKPATAAEEMAEELAHAPAMSYFQFFMHQNKPRKVFIIAGIAVVVIGLGVGAYFAFH